VTVTLGIAIPAVVSDAGRRRPLHRLPAASPSNQITTIFGIGGGQRASPARPRPGAGQGPVRERRADAGILAKGGLSAFSSCGHGVEDAAVGDGPKLASRAAKT
jgi:hypothetical protein